MRIAHLLVVVALASAGCGGNPGKSSQATSPEKPKEAVKEDVAKPSEKQAKASEKQAKSEPSKKKSLQLVLVIDVSGSMYEEDGTKISRVKRVQEATRKALDKLAADDKVAIVGWAYNALLLLPPTPMSSKAKVHDIINRVDMFDVDPGGSSLDKALEIAMKLVEKKPADQSAAILVVVDGEVAGQDACRTMAKKAKANDVPLSVLGLGPEVNAKFLKEIATSTGGRFQAIDSKKPKDVERVFLEEFDLLAAPRKNK